MYERITGDDPRTTPMRIYPAPHYTMGGLWVDYHLMSTVPGLFVLGEANFSEHGANRLGASALMQALADGYFIAPATVTGWLAGRATGGPLPADHPACREALAAVQARLEVLRRTGGSQPVDVFHRSLGHLMIDACGISRRADRLTAALDELEALRRRFLAEVCIPKEDGVLDGELAKALRLEDFFGLADLMLRDALARQESCGAHFREEHQTPDGEALRDDDRFAHVAAWEHRPGRTPLRHSEPLHYQSVTPGPRSYG